MVLKKFANKILESNKSVCRQKLWVQIFFDLVLVAVIGETKSTLYWFDLDWTIGYALEFATILGDMCAGSLLLKI